MSPTLVQGFSLAPFSNNQSVAFAGDVTAGNTIIIVFSNNYYGTNPHPSDSQGNTYTKDAGPIGGANGQGFSSWSAPITSSGPCTVTFSGSAGFFHFGFVTEYSGIAASPYDGANGVNNGGATSLSAGGVTTTANGDLIIGVFHSPVNWGYTSSGGATTQFTDSGSHIFQDQIQTTAGSIDSTAIASGGSASYPTMGWMVAYKASGGAPPASPNSGFLQFM